MASDADLTALAARVGDFLLSRSSRIVTAESCTGGLLAKTLTDIAGSSSWFECGFVTYSNSSKMRDLGVSGRTLKKDGAVSEPVAREMAAGALRVAGVDVAIAITGIAGPEGEVPGKPVGTVWFSSCMRREEGVDLSAEQVQFPGDRAAVRRSSAEYALNLILRLKL
jgi:nicotinamide-nucleotide amidase